MGLRVVYKDVDFSADKIPAEMQVVDYESQWTGWLCNYGSSNKAQQNAGWNTRIFKVPNGVTKVYLSGNIGNVNAYGVSVISNYSDDNHSYVNVAKNVIVNAGVVTRMELDLSNYENANYILWCYEVSEQSTIKLEAVY